LSLPALPTILSEEVETTSLREVLKAAVLAGLIAGAAAAAFHWFFTEPLIDRAVEIEKHSRASSSVSPDEPVVGRPVQKLGLFVGFLLYGAAWGVLFGLFVHGVRRRFSEMNCGKQGFILALLLGWSVAIFPLLKYPANPPGAGEAETIGYRQELFLIFIALSLAGTVAAFAVERSLPRAGKAARAMVIAAYAAYLALIFFLLPLNPDPVKLPPDLIRDFRALSLVGQFFFWAAMGGTFWRFCRTPPARS
jgi:predicted cobalt transporter CbtA